MGKQKNNLRNRKKIGIDNYQNVYENNNMIEKKLTKRLSREIKITIFSIFVVTITMISSAYAVFSSIQKSENHNTLTVGTLKIDFNDTDTDLGNTINLNGAYPESDEEGQKNQPYSFKITNSGSLDAYYKIEIVDDTDMINEDGCQNKLLPKDKIKVSVNGELPILLSSTETNSYIVNDGNLNAGESKIFSIRIWIDEKAGNEVLGKHYHGKIVVEGKNKKANQNIEVAYIYDEKDGDTKCINGEESTCQTTNCYTNSVKDTCPQGTIIKYKVNDTESKYFYILHDDGTTMTMQQRENTVRNIPWYASANNNSYGPTTILPYLESATSTWTNVEFQEYTAGYTNFYENAYTGCTYSTSDYKITCSVNTYNSDSANLTLAKRKVRARMITAQEANSTGCLVWRSDGVNNNNRGTCPDWMYNYLHQSTSYGGSYDDNTVNENGVNNCDYWTMSANSAYSLNALIVSHGGDLNGSNTANTGIGARAVVVISK